MYFADWIYGLDSQTKLETVFKQYSRHYPSPSTLETHYNRATTAGTVFLTSHEISVRTN